VLRSFLVWLQTSLGKGPEEFDPSWSEALLGSLNFWGLLEGTHLISLMLFAGVMLVIDLRLMGVALKTIPNSIITRRLLPLVLGGFAIMVITGTALFFAKPLDYYHNIWFRLKLGLLVLAGLNILWFHLVLHRHQDQWDALERPPTAVRLSGLASITLWLLVIIMGRYIAYNWYECGKPQTAFINQVQACATSEKGAVTIVAVHP
jgi:uncharacterized membrane protein